MMEDMASSKRRTNEDLSMLTPPTPRVNSFTRKSSSNEETTKASSNYSESSVTTSRVTPPSTASPLKYSRDTISPEPQELHRDGITSFATADPPVTDLLAAPASSPYLPQEHRTSAKSSSRSTSRKSSSSDYQNNTIVDTIRELGYRKYLQLVNLPQFLPPQLQAATVMPQPVTSAPYTPSPKKKPTQKQARAGVAVRPSRVNLQAQPKKRKMSEAGETPPQAQSMKSKRSEADQRPPQAQSNKRKRSEDEQTSVFKTPPAKIRKSEDRLGTKSEETPSKRARTAPPTATQMKTTPTKPKTRKTSKKATNIGTSKPEKSRTKEQRWGDYLKSIVGGEKDVYDRLPDLVVPPLGQLIDDVPVRPYTFNKGKVQDYGDGQGLHDREMELAREVGLSYDAYRQQKRMAFIGYAAMQLEGKKEFKKSHTQSLCNIDGNKATHLWIHFHDCWGWMPEIPTSPITTASLGGLQLPDLHMAQASQ
ncbi:hypothetical protein GJ744_004993 [Endocarpon pusillum]|uniref:SWIRM domain-containing protein n=1 Tax=Endocarpon pusillum TaxID=364733 RepID=A0A8H7A647_9EURO|nr:hypothetical protein GJ744_004993 [Endocarpon pusillum]